jgi:hypothetical protein
MRDDLLDVKAAVNWAVAQIPVMTKRVILWRRDKPYTVAIDADSEPGKKLYRLVGIKPLDPVINAEAGAIIHSIRSSLDLLACTLAARNGFLESRGTYFPIWKTEADFLDPKSRVLEKIKRLSEIDQVIIKGLRPYPGGNKLLCAFHDLDLTRKHRRLLNLFVFPRGTAFDGKGPITLEDWIGFDEKAVLISTSATAPDGEIHVGLQIAFNETGVTRSQDVAGPIRNFARLANSIIGLFDTP